MEKNKLGFAAQQDIINKYNWNTRVNKIVETLELNKIDFN